MSNVGDPAENWIVDSCRIPLNSCHGGIKPGHFMLLSRAGSELWTLRSPPAWEHEGLL